MRDFIGRGPYLKHLESHWSSKKTRLLSIYGRRRVGKSALIKTFARQKRAYLFEALEGEDTSQQIRHFLHQLAQICQEPFLADLRYDDWSPVFDLLTQKLNQEKSVLIGFDELSWMAAGRAKLVSLIKFYWDRHWKEHPHLLVILCGSVASWMVKNVVRSKALYGRISENILLDPLNPSEVAQFIGKKRGQKETLEYLLCFGGIPRYLEEFNFNESLQINIEKTGFHRVGFFFDEADKIFYNQFRETSVYKRIVGYLLKNPLSLEDLSLKLKIPSGGGLKQYLDNLTAAGIIEKIPDVKSFVASKMGRYHVIDEYLRFHAQFIRPHQTEILHSENPVSFEKMTKNQWYPYLGYAFERFCLKHRYEIARQLGFDQKVLACGGRLDKEEGTQYDLVYLRNDNVITCCEIKYLTEKPSTRLIKEFEGKLARSVFPSKTTVEKILLTNQIPSESLSESGYFHQILDVHSLLKEKNR